MGFRIKKSIKAGPVRVNFSKSGVGYSVGGKGFRVTKKANGGVRTTASIPGTGISYVSDSGSSKKKTVANNGHRQEVMKPINPTVELCLCLFLGWAGAHKFYAGKTGMGILYLFTLGLFGFGWIIDTIKCVIKVLSAEINTPSEE
jgi:hypothetical protein